MENGKCALAKGLTNGIGLGSSEFHVIRTKAANYRCYCYLWCLSCIDKFF
ncbi:hypothetical protein GMMP15_670009 [Candidatus Magnetomoraceae bacterium gMMP-15]